MALSEICGVGNVLGNSKVSFNEVNNIVLRLNVN